MCFSRLCQKLSVEIGNQPRAIWGRVHLTLEVVCFPQVAASCYLTELVLEFCCCVPEERHFLFRRWRLHSSALPQVSVWGNSVFWERKLSCTWHVLCSIYWWGFQDVQIPTVRVQACHCPWQGSRARRGGTSAESENCITFCVSSARPGWVSEKTDACFRFPNVALSSQEKPR